MWVFTVFVFKFFHLGPIALPFDFSRISEGFCSFFQLANLISIPVEDEE